MAEIYRAWVGTPGGGGQALKLDGTIVDLPTKPPESEFVRKPAGAPAGDFVQTPAGEFAPIGRGTSRTEFLGEVMDRRNQQEVAMAARLGARMGAKQKLDKQGLELGYTVSQERELDALRNSRAEAEKRWRNGELNDEQLKQFEEKIWLKQQATLPQMIRKQATVQEKFQSRMWTDPSTNLMYYFDDKDQPKLLDGMPTNKDMFELAKEIRKAGIELKDKEGELTGKFRDFTEEEVSQRVAEAIRGASEVRSILGGGATGGQQPGVGGAAVGQQPDRGRLDQRPQLRTREDFEQVAKQQLGAMGMSEETLQRALEAEGSYIAVLRRLREEATKAAPAGDQTKKEFLKGKKTRAAVRAPSLGDLRGFGGRGF